MAKGVFLKLLDGYEIRSITGKRFVSLNYSGTVTKEKQKIKEMRFFDLMSKMSKGVAATSSQVYGAAVLTYGVLTVLVHILKEYFSSSASLPLASLIVGIAFSILAIPLLFVDKPISLYFQDNAVTDYIFYEFFCIKRNYIDSDAKTISPAVAIITAVILGGMGYFVPGWCVALGIVACVFVYVTVRSPEFAFFCSQLMLPYLGLVPYSNIVFAMVVSLAGLSFLRKAFSGKRAIFLEQYDLLLAIMLLFITASGIFVKGIESFGSALIMVVMSIGYFLASNIVTNRRLSDCAFNAIVMSSIPVSFITLGQVIYYAFVGDTSALRSGMSSTFSSPDTLAVFLVVALTLGAALAKQSHRGKKVFYSAVLTINIFALAATGEVFALIAVLLAVCAYHAVKKHAFAVLILPVLFLVPYAIFLVPQSVKAALFQFLPTTLDLPELSVLWSSVLSAIRENPFIGIGEGAQSFMEEMAGYGVSGAEDAHNLFLTLTVSSGVFATVAFILMIIVRLRHRVVYHTYVVHSQVRRSAPMLSVCILALLCLGSTDYIWSDYSMYYLFWCVFGLGSATLRVAKKEHDDRVLYYEDTRRTYSSALNVHIK